MKPIQVRFEEYLLAELDAQPEVQEQVRSAVLRQAVVEYLGRRRRAAIAEQYARAYSGARGLGREFEEWEGEGLWPEE